MNPHLKAFFHDKHAQVAWAEFILSELNEEALKRVYAGTDTKAIAEARIIIEHSFKKLRELYTPKKPRKPRERAV
jgi:hypothetical protein